jgi:membrane fusion protein, multidrug efflux system
MKKTAMRRELIVAVEKALSEGAASVRAKRHRATAFLAAVTTLIAVIASFYWWSSSYSSAPAVASRKAAGGSVPVSVAVVARQTVPLYLTGLGTVQASLTVDIRSKVDGELRRVMFTEGQHVKKGDDLAKIDPRLFQAALDQAKAKKAQDEAALIAAEKDLGRAEALILKNVETQQNVDQQRSKVDQTKALISADAAAIESAQTQLDYTDITAPSDGRIGIRLVDPGNMVHASDIKPLANLVLTQPSAVIFTLPAADVDAIREAVRRGPVEVTAFDQDNKVVLSTGTLLLIDNAIDPTTATIRLKAMFANVDDALWPGEFVNARVLVETRHGATTIPNAAIQNGPLGLFAWVVASDDTVQPRPIETGPDAGDSTIVTAGLADGDRVVTAGQYKLLPKTKVVTTDRAPATAEPMAAK